MTPDEQKRFDDGFASSGALFDHLLEHPELCKDHEREVYSLLGQTEDTWIFGYSKGTFTIDKM